MKILVTGGAGFIGSHIVEHFHSRAEVRVLDNLRSGFKNNLVGFKHEFIKASILDRRAVRTAVQGVDYIFHLAAMTSVVESMQKPLECNEVNTIGTLILLEEAASARVSKVVLSSSAAVYGDNPIMPKVETLPPEPKSPYAITKVDGEFYCKMFTDEGRLPTVSLRYFNVFGPRQDPTSKYAAAVPIFIHQAMNHEPITIYGDGEQTRDVIYVKDIVAANAYCATHSEITGIFNVGYGEAIMINDLARTIFQVIGSRSKIKHAAERAGDVKKSMASVDRLRAAGFTPKGSIVDGLKSTVRYYRQLNIDTESVGQATESN